MVEGKWVGEGERERTVRLTLSHNISVVFDTRRGSQPIDYSLPANSHKDPVYSVKWIQSKSNAECVSISTDGQILLWDARALGAPMERHQLLQKSNPRTGLLYDGMMGATALHYDTTYSVRDDSLKQLEGGCDIYWEHVNHRRRHTEPLMCPIIYFFPHRRLNS